MIQECTVGDIRNDRLGYSKRSTSHNLFNGISCHKNVFRLGNA